MGLLLTPPPAPRPSLSLSLLSFSPLSCLSVCLSVSIYLPVCLSVCVCFFLCTAAPCIVFSNLFPLIVATLLAHHPDYIRRGVCVCVRARVYACVLTCVCTRARVIDLETRPNKPTQSGSPKPSRLGLFNLALLLFGLPPHVHVKQHTANNKHASQGFIHDPLWRDCLPEPVVLERVVDNDSKEPGCTSACR
jgi:hypothetical protein